MESSAKSQQREKLLEKKRAIEERLRAFEERERAKERKLDTRRKILAGAAVLEEAQKRPEYHQELMHMLDRFLVRGDDRKLFDLAPGLPPATVVEGGGTVELLEKLGEAVEAGIRAA